MKLLDTNVFMYAAGKPHRWKVPCADLLASAISTPGAYAVNAEVLQELLYVYSARGERDRGIRRVEDILIAFPQCLAISGADVRVAKNLMQKYPFLLPRDAIHAAIVLNHEMEGIVSTDTGFDGLTEILRFDP